MVENFSLSHLSLVNSKKDMLLDIPRDMYPFSVFGSGVWRETERERVRERETEEIDIYI